eukprot:gnl/MRDRNA2_/MRDRNA2_35099_c0_seq1.p1 gnl/MRDRNA2_/MRDRNA2_35099_c0~~gnl/MRDRNA2_/MRDRNA2_35099_c0_seq1.p1  ORF type:complete len:371 (+),score=104.07 gnl/MRDRNA2_/MRDRNA2_35099_c0_seq1:147-1259(+)
MVQDMWLMERFTEISNDHKEEDKEWSMMIAEDVQCHVCQQILVLVLEKVRSFTEDAIADALEGTGDAAYQDRIEKAKNMGTGSSEGRIHLEVAKRWTKCNKNFKELAMNGWATKDCLLLARDKKEKKIAVEQTEGQQGAVPGFCLFRNETRGPISEAEANKYSKDRSTLFFGCENTLGNFEDAVPAALAKALKSQSLKSSLKAKEDIALDVCQKAAKCTKRKHSLSLGQRNELVSSGVESLKTNGEWSADVAAKVISFPKKTKHAVKGFVDDHLMEWASHLNYLARSEEAGAEREQIGTDAQEQVIAGTLSQEGAQSWVEERIGRSKLQAMYQVAKRERKEKTFAAMQKQGKLPNQQAPQKPPLQQKQEL